ncbi:Tod6 protein [Maudiozyma humilis]|uniref:Tod6 protein n=1 Tax=Maudiozyma humilis TaxID=51915 RepID=A0AAV5S064_MAUHU|nr:Tod6 protein [Kazachstania humilis]
MPSDAVMIPQVPHMAVIHSSAPQSESAAGAAGASTSTTTTPDTSQPAKNPSSWDPQDDLLLRHLKEVKNLGWKDIAQYFNNRTPNACQFRWRRLKSGNLKANKTALVDVSDYTSVLAALHDGKLNEYRTVPFVPEPSQNTETTSTLPQSTEVSPHANNNSASPSKEAYANKFIAAGSLAYSHGPSPAIVTETAAQLPPPSAPQPVQPHTSGKRFVKPRSFSHSVTRPKVPAMAAAAAVAARAAFNSNVFVPSTTATATAPSDHNSAENVGFIPKIIVRSRRNSMAVLQNQAGQGDADAVLVAAGPGTSAAASRKNSLSLSLSLSAAARGSRSSLSSRRSSFNVNAGGPSIATQFPLHGADVHLPTTARKNFHSNSGQPEHNFPSSYSGFVDVPARPVRAQAPPPPATQQGPAAWTPQEDELLREGLGRNLSCKEMAILLDNRTETDARSRLAWLQRSAAPAPQAQHPLPDNIDPLHHHGSHLPSFNNILNDVN